jgi:phenylalanyl-tRNA synthetase beta chain
LHPQWQRKYDLPGPLIVCELEAEALETVPLPRAEVPSRFPAVIRDIAVLVDAGTVVQGLLDAICAERPGIVRHVGVFDLYQGAGLPSGRKSLAFRVVMQDTERTLTDAEADEARDAIVALLTRKFSATLRS